MCFHVSERPRTPIHTCFHMLERPQGAPGGPRTQIFTCFCVGEARGHRFYVPEGPGMPQEDPRGPRRPQEAPRAPEGPPRARFGTSFGSHCWSIFCPRLDAKVEHKEK